MYANLRVHAIAPDGTVTEHYAWKVEQTPDKSGVLVYIDAQDGGGNYPEPAGLRRYDATHVVMVVADF